MFPVLSIGFPTKNPYAPKISPIVHNKPATNNGIGKLNAQTTINGLTTINAPITPNIAPLALDTDYWLNFSGGVWALTATPRPFIDGRFDRRVRVSAVLRDASDDIVPTGGTTDINSKRITVSVAWLERGTTATSAVSTYIMNLFNN